MLKMPLANPKIDNSHPFRGVTHLTQAAAATATGVAMPLQAPVTNNFMHLPSNGLEMTVNFSFAKTKISFSS